MKYEFIDLDDFVRATKEQECKWMGIVLIIKAEDPSEGFQKIEATYLLTAGSKEDHYYIESREFPKGNQKILIRGAYAMEENTENKPTLKDFDELKNQGKQELIDFIHEKYPKVNLFNGRVLP